MLAARSGRRYTLEGAAERLGGPGERVFVRVAGTGFGLFYLESIVVDAARRLNG